MIPVAPRPDTTLDLLEASLLLSLAERPAYGYELRGALRELEVGRRDLGRLYRTLRSMEERGLVVSHWETGGPGPARRTYELAGAGLRRLRVQAEAVRRRRRALTRFLDRYERLGARSGAVA